MLLRFIYGRSIGFFLWVIQDASETKKRRISWTKGSTDFTKSWSSNKIKWPIPRIMSCQIKHQELPNWNWFKVNRGSKADSQTHLMPWSSTTHSPLQMLSIIKWETIGNSDIAKSVRCTSCRGCTIVRSATAAAWSTITTAAWWWTASASTTTTYSFSSCFWLWFTTRMELSLISNTISGQTTSTFRAITSKLRPRLS